MPPTRDTMLATLRRLIKNGLTFADCVGQFGVETDEDPYGKAAKRLYHEDGETEIDDYTVISDSNSGAYVLAWVWVDASDVPEIEPEHEREDENAPLQ